MEEGTDSNAIWCVLESLYCMYFLSDCCILTAAEVCKRKYLEPPYYK